LNFGILCHPYCIIDTSKRQFSRLSYNVLHCI